MAILKIYTSESPILRRKAKAIQKFTPQVRQLAKNMIETMREAPGVGLAAPQIGVSDRLIVVEYEDEEYTLANPEIIYRSEAVESGEEGCLSLPTLYGDVDRHTGVHISGLTPKNKRVNIEADGWLARIFQHEIDHLDGVLFIDRMAPGAQLRAHRTKQDDEI